MKQPCFSSAAAFVCGKNTPAAAAGVFLCPPGPTGCSGGARTTSLVVLLPPTNLLTLSLKVVLPPTGWEGLAACTGARQQGAFLTELGARALPFGARH